MTKFVTKCSLKKKHKIASQNNCFFQYTVHLKVHVVQFKLY